MCRSPGARVARGKRAGPFCRATEWSVSQDHQQRRPAHEEDYDMPDSMSIKIPLRLPYPSGPHQCVKAEMSLIRENIRSRENDRGMAHRIGIVLPHEDDLPPVGSHFHASPKLSPDELASRISSAVIRTLPGPNGSTLSGGSHGISWTRPEGVEIVMGFGLHPPSIRTWGENLPLSPTAMQPRTAPPSALESQPQLHSSG